MVRIDETSKGREGLTETWESSGGIFLFCGVGGM